MIHVALIGAGGHSLSSHAPALQLLAAHRPDMVGLAAVCDLDDARAREAAAQFGFSRACGGLDELFAVTPRPDALVAVLPIPAMLTTTPALLARGLPLVIEKPLGRDIHEARVLARMVEEAGAASRVMVSLNRRFDPGVTRALAWARQQGPTRFVRGTMLRVARTEPDFIWGTGIHLIDALWHIAGPLTLESAGALPVAGAGARAGGPDCWRSAQFRGSGGATVCVEIMPTAGAGEEQIRLAGEGFHVDIRTGAAPPWRVQGYRDAVQTLDESGAPDEPPCMTNGTYQETLAFLEALAQGKPTPAPGIYDALASSELAWQLQTR